MLLKSKFDEQKILNTYCKRTERNKYIKLINIPCKLLYVEHGTINLLTAFKHEKDEQTATSVSTPFSL